MEIEDKKTSIKPLRIGVRFKSPAIVLIYEENSKLRKRIMPIRNFNIHSSVRSYTESFREHHSEHLKHVPPIKIEKMFRLVQNNMKGIDLENSLEDLKKEFSLDPEEDLNALDDSSLRRKKEIMDIAFQKTHKSPDDPDFQYDVEVEFDNEATVEPCAWDSDKEDSEF